MSFYYGTDCYDPICVYCDDNGCPECSEVGPIELSDLDQINEEIVEYELTKSND